MVWLGALIKVRVRGPFDPLGSNGIEINLTLLGIGNRRDTQMQKSSVAKVHMLIK